MAARTSVDEVQGYLIGVGHAERRNPQHAVRAPGPPQQGRLSAQRRSATGAPQSERPGNSRLMVKSTADSDCSAAAGRRSGCIRVSRSRSDQSRCHAEHAVVKRPQDRDGGSLCPMQPIGFPPALQDTGEPLPQVRTPRAPEWEAGIDYRVLDIIVILPFLN